MEGETCTLRCPPDHVIVSIDFASFGNPLGDCSNFMRGTCSTPLTKVADHLICVCGNRTSCNVNAESGEFGVGDPCAGTFKALKIEASCGVSLPRSVEQQLSECRNATIEIDKLTEVRLNNWTMLETQCKPKNSLGLFSKCPNMKEVKIIRSADRSATQARKRILFTYLGTTKPITDVSRPFAPHLVLTRNVYVNDRGNVFNNVSRFVHGGCLEEISEMRVDRVKLMYNMKTTVVINTPYPVLNLAQPYTDYYYHALLEILPKFLMSAPALRTIPKLKILMTKGLTFQHLNPLFDLLDLNLKKRDYIIQPGKNVLIFSPLVISPTSRYCASLPRSVLQQLRLNLFPRLPEWNTAGENGILLHDRIISSPNRNLVQGVEVFRLLQQFYGAERPVRMFFGNESLSDTIRLFRGSKIFVSVHSSGMANMIFLPDNATVIEIKAHNFPKTNCFAELSADMGFSHIVHLSGYGGWSGQVPLVMEDFIPKMFNAIERALALALA